MTGARVTLSPRLTAGIFVGIDSGSLGTTYTNASVKGNAYGLFGEYVAGDEREFTVTGSLSLANYTSDGTRVSAGTGIATPGLSTFKNVDSSANMASLAFKYRLLQSPTFVIQPELKLSYVDSKVNGFTETNANTLQALNIQSQSARSALTEVAIGGNGLVNAKLRVNGRLGVSYNSADTARDVTANVVNESTSFTVRSPGMGSTAYNLGVGASYSVTEQLTLSASYRRSMATDAMVSNSYYVNAALSF